MIDGIIKIAIGWFITYKVCNIIKVKGNWATIIKIVGILFMISGFVNFAHGILNF
jgi:hypothetical protein